MHAQTITLPVALSSGRRRAKGIPRLLALWYSRARQRAQLGQLDERQLLDIGISRKLAEVESRKPFWQA